MKKNGRYIIFWYFSEMVFHTGGAAATARPRERERRKKKKRQKGKEYFLTFLPRPSTDFMRR